MNYFFRSFLCHQKLRIAPCYKGFKVGCPPWFRSKRSVVEAKVGGKIGLFSLAAAAAIAAAASVALDTGTLTTRPPVLPFQARRAAEFAGVSTEAVVVTLPDGKTVAGSAWVTTPLDVANGISRGLAQASVRAPREGSE